MTNVKINNGNNLELCKVKINNGSNLELSNVKINHQNDDIDDQEGREDDNDDTHIIQFTDQ